MDVYSVFPKASARCSGHRDSPIHTLEKAGGRVGPGQHCRQGPGWPAADSIIMPSLPGWHAVMDLLAAKLNRDSCRRREG